MTRTRSIIRTATVATAAALSLTLGACGSGSGSASVTRSNNYSYHPATSTVARGATVTFTNRDQTAHTATSATAGFDTGTLNPGQSATIRLDKPGSYTYYCQFHAFMRGTIIVK